MLTVIITQVKLGKQSLFRGDAQLTLMWAAK